jgi:hypothetical protein
MQVLQVWLLVSSLLDSLVSQCSLRWVSLRQLQLRTQLQQSQVDGSAQIVAMKTTAISV